VMELWPENVVSITNMQNKMIINAIGKMVDYIYKNTTRILASSERFVEAIVNRNVSEKKCQWIPNHIEHYYSEKLDDIPSISVREETGMEIVKKLTGRNVPIVLDPTLLLSRQEWDKVTKESINKPKKI